MSIIPSPQFNMFIPDPRNIFYTVCLINLHILFPVTDKNQIQKRHAISIDKQNVGQGNLFALPLLSVINVAMLSEGGGRGEGAKA